ncbi:hypothetical protein MES4922_30379 [Mesorhizobium ventifaucium]|uniref:Uncharacterized protein n=1 Tax=Mesorhizobium ventifaucium TaxID=666020 RepID=A0ABM9DZ89_9HYPH|nr:hypothetical protein MES4922_30379 [Mesorhizobium ventifaucium]
MHGPRPPTALIGPDDVVCDLTRSAPRQAPEVGSWGLPPDYAARRARWKPERARRGSTAVTRLWW